MQQVLQDLRSGRTILAEAPAPLVRPGHLRIQTEVSLISAGTERMLVDFARGSLIDKARQQPEKVKQALQKVRTDGPVATLEAIRSKLSEPVALGYCNVGRVLEVGAGVEGFTVGDRVASNGKHAHVVVVPKTLCAKIPDSVSDESAAFTVLGAIAMQGVRLAQPTIGEAFVVTGLGLVGLLTVQLLRANGCRVLAIDSDPARVALAAQFGAETVDLSMGEDPVARAEIFSGGRGVDGVLLTLSTDSDEPVSQAARMCRKRGRVVLVGITGLKLNRSDFYEKEISFQVSCSYGPGRYDSGYEDAGLDYPFGFVRWTEQRNFEAVLDLLASGALDVAPLVTHRFPITEAAGAYDVLAEDKRSLGILLRYEGPGVDPHPGRSTTISLRAVAAPAGAVSVGFIGAGNYGGRVLIKAFKEAGAELQIVASSSGTSAGNQARQWGFAEATSDVDAVLSGPSNAVCIATRHDSHARYVLKSWRAGKHVFVEKPLCLTHAELDELTEVLTRPGTGQLLTVGFNRRFAPLVQDLKRLLDRSPEPKALTMTVNAGEIPLSHWSQDAQVGGGRLVGEACHFVDLFRFLVGHRVRDISVAGMRRPGGPARTDVASVTLAYEDGSIGVINYLANGHRAVPKERLEVFCGGRTAILNNFLTLQAHGWPGAKSVRRFRQDKGQGALAKAFVQAVKDGGAAPIPLDEILETSRLSIEIAERAG